MILSTVDAFVKPNIVEVKLLNMRVFDVKVLVHWATTELSVITSVTARITHHVIHRPENVSASVGGWEERVIRNVQLVTMDRIVKRSAQKTCHRKQLVIT